MKKASIEEQYEVFGRLLIEDRIYVDPNVTFPMICRWLGADEKELDEKILSELGVNGRTLLRTYRAQEPARLREKYSLLLYGPEPEEKD